MSRVEAQATQVTFLELASALEASWKKRWGKKPSRDTLSVLLAQSALETGHWKYSYCFNLGNAKAGPSWTGDHCFYPADEIVSPHQAAMAYAARGPRTDGIIGHDVELDSLSSGQVRVTLHPDHPWCRFRAFSTLAEGADDYLALLHDRFAPAWPALTSGEPRQFVIALRKLNYFTASLDRYLPPVLKLFEKYRKALNDKKPPRAARSVSLPLPTNSNARPTIRQGATGNLVLELQERLIALGYADVPTHGRFNDRTLSAVELFQLQHIDSAGSPLVADGIIGPKTWWALGNASGDAQKSSIFVPPLEGLTPSRSRLLALLDREHRKPVFEHPDGSNRSRDIDKYFGRTGVLGAPWCCAFVSWALRETLGELPIGGKHHLGVQVMWVMARDLNMETTSPKPGDVFVQIKSGGTGHTGFVIGISEDGERVYTCEGNCGNRLKYGQRSRSSIHHFIDALGDDQSDDFPRTTHRLMESLDQERTR